MTHNLKVVGSIPAWPTNNTIKKGRKYIMEVWEDIRGFPGYQVSNAGHIRSFIDHKGNIGNVPHSLATLVNNRTGYAFVHLYSGESYKNKYVHRLVAEAFCSRSRDKNEVNHIDGDKLNNDYQNLEWCNRSENITHAYRTGLKTTNAIAKAHGIPIKVVETGATFDSITDCSRVVGSSRTKISQCLNDRHPRTTYNGYHFEYLNNNEP